MVCTIQDIFPPVFVHRWGRKVYLDKCPRSRIISNTFQHSLQIRTIDHYWKPRKLHRNANFINNTYYISQKGISYAVITKTREFQGLKTTKQLLVLLWAGRDTILLCFWLEFRVSPFRAPDSIAQKMSAWRIISRNLNTSIQRRPRYFIDLDKLSSHV